MKFKKILFILFIFLNQKSFAQKAAVFRSTLQDSLEMATFLNHLNPAMKSGGLNGEISDSKKNCIPSQAQTALLICPVLSSEVDKSLVVAQSYPVGQFPEILKKQLRPDFFEQFSKKNTFCAFQFKMKNDNQQMIGRRGHSQSANLKLGDDFGDTHQIETQVSCTTEDGISTVFLYSTDLFTKPELSQTTRSDDGTYHLKQTFTTENIFALLQDNKKQNQLMYWKQGVGLINLTDEKRGGFWQATGQQSWFHHLVNRVKTAEANDYQYIEGSQNRWGPFVQAAVGLQGSKSLSQRCQISFSADLGGTVSALTAARHVEASAEARLNFDVGPGALYFRVQDEAIRRTDSYVNFATVAGGYQTKKGTAVEGGVVHQQGNRRDVPDLTNIETGRNDLYIYMKVIVPLQ